MKIYDITGTGANVTGSFSGSFSGDGSNITGISSDGIIFSFAPISSSGQIASDISGSFLLNSTDTLTGDLTVTGQVIAQTLNVQQVTSSIVYSSGSNVFGNTSDNVHQFTGSVNVSNGITGTLTGNASTATSASYATFAANADTVDSLQASQFLRSDTSDTTSGNLTIQGTLNVGTISNGGEFYLTAGSGFEAINLNSSYTYTDTLRVSRIRTIEGTEVFNTNGGNPYLTGNVGIGTTSPLSALSVVTNADNGNNSEYTQTKITIGNQAYPSSIRAYRYGGSYLNGLDLYYNDGTEKLGLRLNSAGNVGIGTTNPSTKLHINTSVENTAALVINSTAATGAGGTGLAILNDHTAAGARNWGIVTENVAFGDFGIFQSNEKGGNPISAGTAKFYIKNDGNIGIGTIAPEQKLHVEGTIQLGNGNDLAWAYDNGNYYNYITNFYNTGDGILFRSGQWTGNQSIITHSFETYTEGWQKRLVITQEGNVGIGTTSPGNKLHVAGGGILIDNNQDYRTKNSSGTQRTLIYMNSSNKVLLVNDDGDIILSSTGNVGIGTTNPIAKLQVDGQNANGLIQAYVTSGGGNALRLHTNFVNGNYIDINPYISGVSNGGLEISQNGTQRIVISAGGNVGIGTTNPSGKFHIDNGDTYNQGILHEYVSTYVSRTKFGRPGTTSNLELYYDIAGAEIAKITRNYSSAQLQFDRAGTVDMIINGSGNVGIGTTNLPFKLNVESSTDTGVKIKSSGASGSARLVLNPEGAGAGSTGDGSIFFDMNSTAWVAGVDKSDGSKFKIANDVYGDFRANNYFAIQTNGNVGIGTTDPGAKLHVHGGAIKAQHIQQGYYSYGLSGTVDGASTVSVSINFNGQFNTGYVLEVYAYFNHWNSTTTNYTFCYRKGIIMGYGDQASVQIDGPGGGYSDSVSVGAWTFSTDNFGAGSYGQSVNINKSAGGAGWQGTYFIKIVSSVPLDPIDVS